MKPYQSKTDIIIETLACIAGGAILGFVMTYLGMAYFN